jgi:hypothetical protein
MIIDIPTKVVCAPGPAFAASLEFIICFFAEKSFLLSVDQETHINV